MLQDHSRPGQSTNSTVQPPCSDTSDLTDCLKVLSAKRLCGSQNVTLDLKRDQISSFELAGTQTSRTVWFRYHIVNVTEGNFLKICWEKKILWCSLKKVFFFFFATITSQIDTSHSLVLLAPCPSRAVLRAFLPLPADDLKRGSADKDLWDSSWGWSLKRF